jgi:predicted HAD superfamily hydrolase
MSNNEILLDNIGLDLQKFTNIELFSFDIFDTLITRKIATPYGVFAIMQDILLKDSHYNIPKYIRQNFYEYRMAAERYMYSYNSFTYDYSDCNFDEIYEIFKSNYSLSDMQTNSLKELEKKIEYENVIPIGENIDFVKKILSQNNNVILISDMYHSSSFIKSLLVQFDKTFENIPLYVSNEFKKKKHGGELYKDIKNIYNVAYEKWFHFGDNLISDIQDAQTLGIKAIRYVNFELTNNQNLLLNKIPQDKKLQLMIGCEKISCLENKNEIYKIGATLAGPILVPYVLWLLREARQKGLKRLYFIARDGYILKKIADSIIEENNFDIETKYIYGSRIAWQLPALTIDVNHLIHIIKQYGTNKELLSKSLDITEKELVSFLPKYFDFKNKHDIFNALKDNKEFVNTIHEKHQSACLNLINYLKQEIDFSDDNFAFVDLSGSGVTQNCLASVINTFYPKPIISYYLRNGVYKIQPQNVERYFYLLRNDGCAKLELLVRAPHGQTLGYKLDENDFRYYPILDEKSSALSNWDFDNYIKGILEYSKNCIKTLDAHQDLDIENSFIPSSYLDWLGLEIDAKTAEILGSVIFSHNGSKESNPIAPKISQLDAIKYLLGLSKLKTDLYDFSYMRSDNTVKKILDFKKEFSSLRKYLLHVQYSKRKKEFYLMIFGCKIGLQKLLWKE